MSPDDKKIELARLLAVRLRERVSEGVGVSLLSGLAKACDRKADELEAGLERPTLRLQVLEGGRK